MNDIIGAVSRETADEAHEDYVGVWQVVRSLRSQLPEATDSEIRVALEAVVTTVLAGGIVLGQFGEDRVFRPWPPEQTLGRLRDELAVIGQDPDIGEVCWFVADSD